MIKYLLFEPIYYEEYCFDDDYYYVYVGSYDLIKLIYDKYTLKSEKEANVNLLINELRKDKDILKKYDSLKYDIIYDEENDYYIAIDTITDEVYKDFDMNIIINDLTNLFDLDYVKNDTSNDHINIYYSTNEKVINIILNLENDVKYNVLNKYNFNIYYIEIQDEINKYITFKYINTNYMKLRSNKYTVLNNQSNQYLVINEDHNDINYYKKYYDIDDHNYLILYYDYDQYFKDNYKKYITKYKELFSLNSEFSDFEILIKSLNVIKNDNNLKNYVKYKIFLDKE